MTVRVLGIMSGSSLDGLDLALCVFRSEEGSWHFRIERAITVPYAIGFRERLRTAGEGSAIDLARLDRDLGNLIGEQATGFIGNDPPDLIASHGHTIFHQPDEHLTLQIGDGSIIAARTGIPVVYDMRKMDVALGGQGAPLVPRGEHDLFPGTDTFLNLGGIANIAHHTADGSVGYDICPCAQVLDHLANEADRAYDEGGAIARNGTVHGPLLATLEAIPFYQQTPPRSLGREWTEAHLLPLVRDAAIPLADRMRTIVEHIAGQVGRECERLGARRMLVTGGGAHNVLLVDRIRVRSGVEIVVPDALLIDFKEAMIFAYLGLLRWLKRANCMASVTGASQDAIGGALVVAN